ncbi:MAG TPA: RNA polymerase sigma factor [Candidatus Nitrosotalea sp.]|nr:RNA polymerase sigma factor [Candidatus Nitrosotalea sp.]
MPAEPDLESLVTSHYSSLYQFAASLTRNEHDACDLTQQTFLIWATKGHQLRDVTKVKTWLFTTLYREFLEKRRRQVRFPHHELDEAHDPLPHVSPVTVNQLDSAAVLEALGKLDENFHAPLALFYLEDYSYKEIAEVLNIPLGTVKSRIARGIVQLHKLLDPKRGAIDTVKQGIS